jgi:hypothetical protein
MASQGSTSINQHFLNKTKVKLWIRSILVSAFDDPLQIESASNGGGPTELFAKPNSTIMIMSRLMSSTHAAFPSGGLSQWPSCRMRTGLSRGLYTRISLAAGRGNWLSFPVIWFDGESLGWTIRIKMDPGRRFPSIRRQDDDKHRQMILGRIWWMESDDDDLTYRDANGVWQMFQTLVVTKIKIIKRFK